MFQLPVFLKASSALMWLALLVVGVAELWRVHWDVGTIILLVLLASCLRTTQRSCQQIESALEASPTVPENVVRNSRVLFAEIALVALVGLCIALLHTPKALRSTQASAPVPATSYPVVDTGSVRTATGRGRL